MDRLVLLLPLLPLMSALLTQLLGARLQRRVSRISVIGGALTFLLAGLLLILLIGDAPSVRYAVGENWGSILFDPLSVLMSTLIAGIAGPLLAGHFKDMAQGAAMPGVWMTPFIVAGVACLFAAAIVAFSDRPAPARGLDAQDT